MKKQDSRKKQSKGFSLIELLIAMAVLLVIVGALIVSGQRAIRAANTTASQQSVSSLASSAQAFSHGWQGFPTLATQMGGQEVSATTAATFAADQEIPTAEAALLDGGTYVNGGYKFSFKAGPDTFVDSAGNTVSAEFEFTAIPISISSGTTAACSDQTGVWTNPTGGPGATVASGAGCRTDGYLSTP